MISPLIAKSTTRATVSAFEHGSLAGDQRGCEPRMGEERDVINGATLRHDHKYYCA